MEVGEYSTISQFSFCSLVFISLSFPSKIKVNKGRGGLEELLDEMDSCPHQTVQEVQDDVVSAMQVVGKLGQNPPPLSNLGVSGSVTCSCRKE